MCGSICLYFSLPLLPEDAAWLLGWRGSTGSRIFIVEVSINVVIFNCHKTNRTKISVSLLSQLILCILHNFTHFLIFLLDVEAACTCFQNTPYWDFPGCPMVKTLCSQCKGCGLDPWLVKELRSCMPLIAAKKTKIHHMYLS